MTKNENTNIYECDLKLDQSIFFVTNKNFKEYYLDEGTVYSIKFTKYNTIFIEVQCANEVLSCAIEDVFKTKEEADIKSPSRFEYYLNKRNKNYST